MNKTNLFIIIMLSLAILLSCIYNKREGMKFDRRLSILNKETKGRCVYHEDGVNDLNSRDSVLLPGIDDQSVIDGYKRNCAVQPNQVMCERTHEPNTTGEHVLTYCDWELGE